MNAPITSLRAGQRVPFTAYVCDDATADALRPVVAEMGWPVEKVHKGGLRNAVQSLSVSASPQILLVDLSESIDPLGDINALAEVCEPGTVVIATGQVNDVRLYRDLVISGIQDYLLKPLSPDTLRDAFMVAHAMLHAPKINDAGVERAHCATAVIGARGGVGASSVASSVAWLLSERNKRSTALLDLDVHFGTAALTLDLEPGRGLTDAIENPSRIDGLFIERAMVKSSATLSVLSAEAPINAPLITDGSAFFQLQEEMRAAFECTVIDLPRNMLVQYPQLIADIQLAVIVTDLTLVAARDTIRLLSWFKTNAPQTQIHIVANRVPPSALLEISRKDFENSIERRIDYILPFDPKLAMEAAKLGKPLAEAGKGSKTIVPLAELADALMACGDAAGSASEGAKKAARGRSLIGKFAFKTMLSKKK
ncbi:CpaE family protein [Sphingomonas qilianensis]|uniref:Pilus assembly protein CpaE n=1 Tax=Sphingomonas qilianensis TaxID=1736690 RepID=A0ABU9XPV8_9SPHN